MGVWLCEATDLVHGASRRFLGLTEARDNRFSVSGIPDTAGHHGRAENKLGGPGGISFSPGDEERRGQGERGHWVVPM